MYEKIETKKLKTFASEKLPTASPLRELILAEPDFITTDEFLIKIDIFLKLLRMEKG